MVAAPQAQPAPLSLCGVQLLGAVQLAPSQHMQQLAEQLVVPASLAPNFTLPIDGDSGSCLQAPPAAVTSNGSSNSSSNGSSSSRWQLQLDGSYPLLALQMEASAASNGSVVVSLLDAGGGVAASWRAPSPAAAGAAGSGSSSGHSNGSGNHGSDDGGSVATWELPAAMHAAAVRGEGFAALCELRLLAAAARAATGYLLVPLPASDNSGTGNSGAGSSSSGSVHGWQVRDAAAAGSPSDSCSCAALFDGDLRSCFTAQPVQPPPTGSSGSGSSGALQAAALEILLDRPYR